MKKITLIADGISLIDIEKREAGDKLKVDLENPDLDIILSQMIGEFGYSDLLAKIEEHLAKDE